MQEFEAESEQQQSQDFKFEIFPFLCDLLQTTTRLTTTTKTAAMVTK